MDWDLRVLLERPSLHPSLMGRKTNPPPIVTSLSLSLLSIGTSTPVSVKGYLVNVLGVQITLL